MDMKFEVAVLPVADVDRAKAFYQGLGWRLDADIAVGRATTAWCSSPRPSSPASIQFGTGITTTDARARRRACMLVVEDIEAARAELIGHGADVSEVCHGAGLNAEHGACPVPTRRAARTAACARSRIRTATAGCCRRSRSGSRAGCGTTDVAALAELLHETAEHHGAFEAVAPPHDWWDWYAAYMDARQRGSTPEEASAAAGRYMAEVKHVVV